LKSLENKVDLSWKIMENHSQISVGTLCVSSERFFTLRTSCVAVCCNRPCLWVGVWG